jgi:hypothetical protein
MEQENAGCASSLMLLPEGEDSFNGRNLKDMGLVTNSVRIDRLTRSNDSF